MRLQLQRHTLNLPTRSPMLYCLPTTSDISKKDAALLNNIEKINQQIVAPLLELLCAGEEVRRRHIGARTIDAG